MFLITVIMCRFVVLILMMFRIGLITRIIMWSYYYVSYVVCSCLCVLVITIIMVVFACDAN